MPFILLILLGFHIQHFTKYKSGGRLMFYKCMCNGPMQGEVFGAHSIKDIRMIGKANAVWPVEFALP